MTLQRLIPTERPPYLAKGRDRASIAAAVRAGARVFLSGQNALSADGGVVGPGDPAAQTNAALDRIEAALSAAGGSFKDITKLTTCIADRDHRKAVYEAIGRRLPAVFPVSTGLVAAGLPLPDMMVQIDAEAVIPEPGADPVRRLRTFELKDWFGQNIAWQGAMVAASEHEIFVRGQTGSALDGTSMAGLGRSLEDAAAQAERALSNLALLLREAGSRMDDVCKITVYISDRAYRPAVYPVIGKHFRGIHPVSTGIIMAGFARPEILFEIDAQVLPKQSGVPHTRVRPYHSNVARYGTEQQPLDCDFCMAVRAGRHVVLRGQTGVDLNEVMRGRGDAAAQARQAMDNVETLLAEAGAHLSDVVKVTVFVTDRAFLAGVSEAVLDRLQGVAPAFTVMIVKGLASPELLMEVDVTAIIPEQRS
jgi:enamine deaminase RidA (YjgF/YER057c/UK114 family)